MHDGKFKYGIEPVLTSSEEKETLGDHPKSMNPSRQCSESSNKGQPVNVACITTHLQNGDILSVRGLVSKFDITYLAKSRIK